MTKTIFVVAHSGGCEGYSLPFIAFASKDQAMLWLQSQFDAFDVIEVPIFPNLPRTSWLHLEPLAREKVTELALIQDTEEWPF